MKTISAIPTKQFIRTIEPMSAEELANRIYEGYKTKSSVVKDIHHECWNVNHTQGFFYNISFSDLHGGIHEFSVYGFKDYKEGAINHSVKESVTNFEVCALQVNSNEFERAVNEVKMALGEKNR